MKIRIEIDLIGDKVDMLVVDGDVNYVVGLEKINKYMELDDLVKMKFMILRMNGEMVVG